jgi:hypothetical protein
MKFSKSPSESISVKRRSPKLKKSSKILELAIVAVFALVLIYGASFAIRISHGFSRTIDSAEYTLRIQISNGCGIDGAANRVAQILPGRVKLPLEVNIVDIADFDAYHVTESFLISREKDLSPVKLLAGQLGLSSDDILYRPIEDNYRSITATLVLGDDFENIIGKQSKRGK